MASAEEPEKKEEQPTEGEENLLRKVLKKFSESNDALEIKSTYEKLREMLKDELVDRKVYQVLSKKSDHPRVQEFCQTLESNVNKPEFKKEGRDRMKGKQILIVGAGPCGLRAAIELALLGMKVVVVEKRTKFTRNSVLQLWVFLVEDLKAIGFKAFHPKFGLDDRLHVSIRRLQLVLLKMALLLEIEVHLGVEFKDLIPPNKKKAGWKAQYENLEKSQSDLKSFEFEGLIIANGRQQPKEPDVGLEWVTIKRKLAIAVAANFENKNKDADFKFNDTGGKDVMKDLSFFTDLKEKTEVDLENLVYIRGETHYFVMTGKKDNLISRGVLKEDKAQAEILDKSNIDRDKLINLAKDVAQHCTDSGIPLEMVDVDIFEFTSRAHAKEPAVLKAAKKGNDLMIGLVGDSLKQPFWPEGVGIAHGYFSVFDTVWMMYEWLGLQLPADEVLQNRKDTYGCLKEITKGNMVAVRDYGIDPLKRYAKYRDMKNREAQEKTDVIPEVVNKKKKKDDTSPNVVEEAQGSVSKTAQKFGGKKAGVKKTNEGELFVLYPVVLTLE
ncbi:hypothetical protein BSL78_00986 [Apostichopus japonicus]|uniref:Uncharacterized protein n=1 Tax=Stichopus japonicus TaxID=307972 RepID=A0A2G8LPC1_STIJA|nr:hypothetical protein BSL78_00986 [Apostichopus japonicus]